jgi:hypothetical protein
MVEFCSSIISFLSVMKKKSTKANANDSMEELEKFYNRKVMEQEALKKLLKALVEKSSSDKDGAPNLNKNN